IEWGTQFHPPWSEMELIVDDITAALIDFSSVAPCAAGSIVVAPTTSQLSFVDIPAGTGTARAVVFSAQSCAALTLQVTAGPTLSSGPGTLGLPLGGVVTLPAATNALPREARIWVSYTAGAAGSHAAGSVTIKCPQTGGQWTIPITANAIAKPTVAAMLVLDRSGSMDFPSGLPGKKRIDVLHEAAPSFVELLGATDGIGVVGFDQNASLSAVVAQAGPLGFGAGRATALAAISSHQPNPLGSTSIGDGVELAHDTVAAVSGYDRRAVIVLTDGEENTAKFIADIASKIDNRVYAIGLGTAAELNPIALSALVKNTGGYLMLTGPLTPSEQFRVTKYFLQILSGVVNNQIVVDPQGYIGPNTVVRVPFDLTEADTSAEVVLLSPYRKYLDFRVETPSGEVIDPSTVSSLVDSVFVPGRSLDEYHLSLPAIWPTHSAQAGRWHALLELRSWVANTGLASSYREQSSFEPGEAERRTLVAHGAPWLVTVQAQSSLTMTADATAQRATPATLIDHRVVLRQLDIPLDTPCAVRVEATDPGGSTVTLSLSGADVGVFVGVTAAPVAGVYSFRYVADGTSLAGVRFTREQVRTVGVWFGGDDPPPRAGGDGHEGGHASGCGCCTDVIECLLEDRGVRRLLERYDIDGGRILKCLAEHDRTHRNS
ncbi:MAG: VWA domain-containing protein, partial [Propionicimonas sp.]